MERDRNRKMKKKIKLVGTGGQGIKLLGHVLGNILAELGYNVSLNFEFDTSVRGGNISADLIYSDGTIECPIIDDADILFGDTQILYPDGFKRQMIAPGLFPEW